MLTGQQEHAETAIHAAAKRDDKRHVSVLINSPRVTVSSLRRIKRSPEQWVTPCPFPFCPLRRFQSSCSDLDQCSVFGETRFKELKIAGVMMEILTKRS